LSELYKANKDQVSCFGFRTQYGGGKSTGFALIYDSPEAMKQFEPRYRLIRYGQATKIEKASRQQRMCTSRTPRTSLPKMAIKETLLTIMVQCRQAKEEPIEGATGYSEDEAGGEEEEIDGYVKARSSCSSGGVNVVHLHHKPWEDFVACFWNWHEVQLDTIQIEVVHMSH